jgi:hypothetical protein
MTPGYAKTRQELPWLYYPEADRVIINAHNFGGGGPLLQDDFIDTNGIDLSSHQIAPVNTFGAMWAEGGINLFGNPTGLSILSNRAVISGGSSVRVFGKVLSAGVPDCTLSGVFGYVDANTGGTGFVFRYADGSNYWRCDIAKAAGVMRIIEVTAGVLSVRQTGGVFTAGSLDIALQLVLDGNQMTFTSPYGEISHTSAVRNTAGVHGISVNQLTNCDSFLIA